MGVLRNAYHPEIKFFLGIKKVGDKYIRLFDNSEVNELSDDCILIENGVDLDIDYLYDYVITSVRDLEYISDNVRENKLRYTKVIFLKVGLLLGLIFSYLLTFVWSYNFTTWWIFLIPILIVSLWLLIPILKYKSNRVYDLKGDWINILTGDTSLSIKNFTQTDETDME